MRTSLHYRLGEGSSMDEYIATTYNRLLTSPLRFTLYMSPFNSQPSPNPARYTLHQPQRGGEVVDVDSYGASPSDVEDRGCMLYKGSFRAGQVGVGVHGVLGHTWLYLQRCIMFYFSG